MNNEIRRETSIAIRDWQRLRIRSRRGKKEEKKRKKARKKSRERERCVYFRNA